MVVPEMFVIKSVAEMLVVPVATAVARPCEPAVLLIVATSAFDELHKTNFVTSSVEPLANVSVAVNCCCVVVPKEMTGLTGVTVKDMALVTVIVVLPEILFDKSVAVMVAVPTPTDVTRPFEPVVSLTVATPVLDELHVTAAFQFNVVPSEKTAVATNSSVVPLAMVASAGVILRD